MKKFAVAFAALALSVGGASAADILEYGSHEKVKEFEAR